MSHTVKPEVEVCESEIHRSELYEKCNKNPGHLNFISPETFNLDCLPSVYRDQEVLNFVNALSDLTVLISLNVTSESRPKFYPNTKVPFPYYDVRGGNRLRFGTGQIWMVKKKQKKVAINGGKGFGRFLNRRVSYGVITVVTAAHLVYDKAEAESVVCHLNYDSADEMLSDIASLQGVGIVGANATRDKCVLKCVTYDLALVDKLMTSFAKYKSLCRSVHAKYSQFRESKKLTVVVSHPHGQSKKISVGHWTKRHLMDEENENLTSYSYTACTCPGSSGAPVYTFGGEGKWFLSTHLHMGVTDKGNQSCFCWE
ncbi:hypothetical protein BgiBS90_013464 [Biomphalaria glabrata]|nr:hypothetical protein BgiBS90_013464 [Biomphalaria glabrata]